MKKIFIILFALIGMGFSANAQAYQTLKIESNTDRYNRELEELRLKQEIERLKSGQTNQNNNQSPNLKTGSDIETNYRAFYSDVYSDTYITARLGTPGYNSTKNCGGDMKPTHLYIKNKTNRTITVTGIIKVEFCQCCCDYQCWNTEKTFEITIPAHTENKVNDYYKPSSKIGYYQTLLFWIDEIRYSN
jgi:hypothetical protein